MFDKDRKIITGGVPYPGMDIDVTFVQTLKRGYRMEKPTCAPENL